MNRDEFLQEAQLFLTRIFRLLNDRGAALDPHWEINHICYRVETCDQYRSYKKLFSGFGDCIAESPVGGRPISVFRLHDPIPSGERTIPLLELPAPKKGKTVKTGFEHIEIVCDCSFESLMERYKTCQLDCSGLSKSVNRELEMKLDDLAVKFHHQSLEAVIEMERG